LKAREQRGVTRLEIYQGVAHQADNAGSRL
jgi:hypothetical protein